jgi:hypothetical protein
VKHPVPAIKLLYRIISRTEADAMLEKISSEVQEVGLPKKAIQEVRGVLERSNFLLPERERVFKGWRVGLLERWEAN